MRSVITGATGYLGRHLANFLDGLGHEVVVIVRDLNVAPRPVSFNPSIEIESLSDCTDIGTIIREVAPDSVYHLAAATGDASSELGTPIWPGHDMICANTKMAVQAAAGVAATKGAVLICAASWWEWDENGVLNPNNFYAATKSAGRFLAEKLSRMMPFTMISIVMHDIYGANDWRPKLFNQLIRLSESDGPLKLTPGHQQMNLIHVDDACRALVAAYDSVKNISSAEGPLLYAARTDDLMSLRDIVSSIEHVRGTSLPVDWGAKDYRVDTVMRPNVPVGNLSNWLPIHQFEKWLAGEIERQRNGET